MFPKGSIDPKLSFTAPESIICKLQSAVLSTLLGNASWYSRYCRGYCKLRNFDGAIAKLAELLIVRFVLWFFGEGLGTRRTYASIWISPSNCNSAVPN